MSLRLKFLFVISLLGVIFISITYYVQSYVIFPYFLSIEKKSAFDDIQRVEDAISREVKHLQILCYDWGSWDDSYHYVLYQNHEFVDLNFSLETYKVNNLNAIYVFNTKREAIWQGVLPERSAALIQEDIFESDNFLEILGPLFIPEKEKVDRERIGVWNTSRGLMLFAARSMLTSNYEGPSRGVLMMGRLLDQTFVEQLREQTKVNFRIDILGQDEENQKALWYSDENRYQFRQIDSTQLEVQTVITNLANAKIGIITIMLPREIAQSGKQAIYYSLLIIIGIQILTLGIFWYLLGSLVLSPLIRMINMIQEIRDSSDLSRRLRLERSDELGVLVKDFNNMMEVLEDKSDKLNLALEEIKTSNVLLKEMANIDALTGLPNRRTFDRVMKRVWLTGVRREDIISVAFCDLDYFKRYNDFYGHQEGDHCLQKVGYLLNQLILRSVDFVARYGGEEFVIVLPNAPKEGAIRVAEKLLQHVRDLKIPHEKSDVAEIVTLSIGIATVHLTKENSLTAEQLLEQADRALYQAKSNGRNGYAVAQWDNQVRLK